MIRSFSCLYNKTSVASVPALANASRHVFAFAQKY